MASTSDPVFLPALRGRVVHRLSAPVSPVPVITPLPPAVRAGPQTVPAITARSPFWQSRLDQLEDLRTLQQGLTGIDGKISELSVPTEFNVTTQMSAADAALMTRSVVAAETLAQNTAPPPPDTCATREDISDLAFSIIARLTTLTARLMDRQDVSLDSVLDKLTDAENHQLIGETSALLMRAEAEGAAELLRRAVDVQPFAQWLDAGMRQDDPRVFAELNRRAALLLAAKCLAATGVTGDADDWPPPRPAPVPSAPTVNQPSHKSGKRGS